MTPKLVDLAMTKAEIKEEQKEGMISPGGQPDPYPWGLHFHLEDRELAKLGIDKLPEVGSEITLMVLATVKSVSQNAGGGDKETTVGLTMVKACVCDTESAEEEKGESAATEAKETKSLMSYTKGR